VVTPGPLPLGVLSPDPRDGRGGKGRAGRERAGKEEGSERGRRGKEGEGKFASLPLGG